MNKKLIKKIRSKLRPFKLAIWAFTSTLKNRTKRLIRPPKLPQNPDGKVLIHLGCGEVNDSRYINVDGLPFPHVHYVSRVEKLPMFPANYADLIYACHTLEHISHLETLNVLREWRRILKIGGILRLSLPDFDKILDIYNSQNKNMESIELPLMGGQEYIYNFHKAMFNEKYLKKILTEIGFKEVRTWDPATAQYYYFNDWAKRFIKNRYPVSLNIEATK